MSIINNPKAALTVGDRLVRVCIKYGYDYEQYKRRWKICRSAVTLEEPITSIKYQEYELDWWEIKPC